MAEYKTPGVYIEEIPHLPPSIASVETAIPAFIGYTEKIPPEKEPGAIINKPLLISSIFEYEQNYGAGFPETDIKVNIDASLPTAPIVSKTVNKPKYLMYYALQMFFANGGGQCYIVSVGDYTTGQIMETDLSNGLGEIEKIRDITLIVFPDAINMTQQDYYKIHQAAIQQCVHLQSRFTVMDVWIDDANPTADNVKALRDATLHGSDLEDLRYAAVYYPRIYAEVIYQYKDTDVTLVVINDPNGKNFNDKMSVAKGGASAYYYAAQNAISNFNILMPASSAMVGIYANVDNSRGVWKAPANAQIINALKPEIAITDLQQQSLNVDADAGKSINAIRSFPGRGPAIVWGARTLAGNSNEWRYISVRRFFIMVEQSVKNATEQFVFEPNDENTWLRIKSMIQNYLSEQWKAGALMGTSPQEAYFVHIGLGQTMTELDIWEGRLIVEIGMAAVRPAEFIILRFMHKMLSES